MGKETTFCRLCPDVSYDLVFLGKKATFHKFLTKVPYPATFDEKTFFNSELHSNIMPIGSRKPDFASPASFVCQSWANNN